jgi:myo-inositol-hexaphosphate 3-phosphohydrolase
MMGWFGRRGTAGTPQAAMGRGLHGAGAVLMALSLGAPAPVPSRHADIAPIDRELDGPGTNVDAPCFWLNRGDPSASLLFATAKDSGLVEVFEFPSGRLVGIIGGFGRPNNCVVHGDLLLTTDREAGKNGAAPGGVKVHHLPDLTPIRTLASDTSQPHGIDVLTTPPGGAARVYVSDSADASIHVYDLESGAAVAKFPTGFGAGIEPVLVDDERRRLFVARGEKEKTRGIGVFDLEGRLQREFGAGVLTKDGEGMALYRCGDGGYLVIVDQHKKKTQFEIFDRGTLEHVASFTLADAEGEPTSATDGIAIVQDPVPGFPTGFLAACDGCGTNEPDEIDVVSWERIAGALGLRRCPGGIEEK